MEKKINPMKCSVGKNIERKMIKILQLLNMMNGK